MNSNSDRDGGFLGAGVAFRFGVDDAGRLVGTFDVDADGRLAMNSLEAHVRQSILLILQTAPGERVMNPQFGAGLNTLVFAPLTASTSALVEHEVKEALLTYEPRIDLVNVKAALDPAQGNALVVHIDYRVRQTDSMFNLVYPFFLERGQR